LSNVGRTSLRHRSLEPDPSKVRLEQPTPLLTVRDVAAYTGVSEKTIRRAIRGGRLRAFKLPGGLRFRVEDVDAWLESYLVQPDPPEQDGARRTLSEVLA
jgi:excisionase family DNA binding protein